MKFIFCVLTFLVLLPAAFISANGQEDKRVIAIRSKVAAINKNAPRYKKTTRDVPEISTEGAEATYFHKGDELKKITAKIYGETFNASAELYFEAASPLFYYLKINRYDTQIGLSKPVKVVKIIEERYYFAAAEMIKVMAGKKVIKESDENYTEMRDGILKLAEELKKAYAN